MSLWFYGFFFYLFKCKNCQFGKTRCDTSMLSSFLNCFFAPVVKDALKIIKSAAGMLYSCFATAPDWQFWTVVTVTTGCILPLYVSAFLIVFGFLSNNFSVKNSGPQALTQYLGQCNQPPGKIIQESLIAGANRVCFPGHCMKWGLEGGGFPICFFFLSLKISHLYLLDLSAGSKINVPQMQSVPYRSSKFSTLQSLYRSSVLM